jgi:5-methylthioadenosine/S-adenosylhomocysteine deaminase
VTKCIVKVNAQREFSNSARRRVAEKKSTGERVMERDRGSDANDKPTGENQQSAAADPQGGSSGVSRRGFIGGAAMGAAAASAGLLTGSEAEARWKDRDDWRNTWHDDRIRDRDCPQGGGHNDRILLKGGIVLSMDPAVGDFEKADVLIEGKKIKAIGRNINAHAQVVDCSGMIVMPGFITTHHHQDELLYKSTINDGTIMPSEAWPQESFFSVINMWGAGQVNTGNVFGGPLVWDLERPPYDLEHQYLAHLYSSLSEMNQGVTCGTDTSSAAHSPEYTDAMIQGLMDSGRRTLYAYSPGTNRSGSTTPNARFEYPGIRGNETLGIGRLRKEWFNSDDQLVTLGFGGGPGPAFPGATYGGWELARSVGAFINNHDRGPAAKQLILSNQNQLGPDVTLVHCCIWQDEPTHHYSANFKSEIFQILADKGVHVSCVPLIDQQMGQGMPAFQNALNHGILPSLSPDVDTNMTPDPFSMMRGAFCVQRLAANEFEWPETDPPPGGVKPRLVTCRQVIEMATIAGAAGSGLLSKVGTLTPGKEADIVFLDTNALNAQPMNNVPGTIVTMMDTSNVRHVMVAGKMTKWNGRLVGWDVNKLIRDVQKARDKVLARLRGPDPQGRFIPKGNNSENPYRPNFFGSCCDIGKDPNSPRYVYRP